MALNNNIPLTPVTPAPNYNCDVSTTLTPEDNQTYINSITLKLVACDDIPLNTTADFWNCNICGSDEKYWQPVVAGDVIREQVAINTNTYQTFKAFLFDSGTGLPLADNSGIVLSSFTDAQGNTYLNITITANSVDSECFYWKIYGFETEINEGTLSTCIAARLPGVSATQAEIDCCITQSPEYAEFYSEEYQKVDPDCVDTLLIGGHYTKYDCDGNFYGTATAGTNTHELLFRIEGYLEKAEFGFEETLVFNTRRSSKQNTVYNFKTPKIPPYVVEKLAKAFNSQYVTIDGVQYKRGVKLSKNFDEGKMWIIDTTLQRDCDEIDFLC